MLIVIKTQYSEVLVKYNLSLYIAGLQIQATKAPYNMHEITELEPWHIIKINLHMLLSYNNLFLISMHPKVLYFFQINSLIFNSLAMHL